MMKEYYKGLSNELLREEMQTLHEQLRDAEEVLNSRTGKELYRCAECEKTDDDIDVIYNHLIDDHNYPDEDASICIERIYA